MAEETNLIITRRARRRRWWWSIFGLGVVVALGVGIVVWYTYYAPLPEGWLRARQDTTVAELLTANGVRAEEVEGYSILQLYDLKKRWDSWRHGFELVEPGTWVNFPKKHSIEISNCVYAPGASPGLDATFVRKRQVVVWTRRNHTPPEMPDCMRTANTTRVHTSPVGLQFDSVESLLHGKPENKPLSLPADTRLLVVTETQDAKGTEWLMRVATEHPQRWMADTFKEGAEQGNWVFVTSGRIVLPTERGTNLAEILLGEDKNTVVVKRVVLGRSRWNLVR